jgi:rhodanese-related sulfurtransferase
MADLSDSEDVFDHISEVQIVDVREQYEFDAGGIEGAIHIPLNSLMGGAGDDQLSKDKPVVVVCRSGNRSELGMLMLKARGYEAHNLEGGMEDWDRKKLPFSAPDGGPGRVA